MDDPQMLSVVIEFQVEHNPGNDHHLEMIAANYFRGKGVKFQHSEVVEGHGVIPPKIIV